MSTGKAVHFLFVISVFSGVAQAQSFEAKFVGNGQVPVPLENIREITIDDLNIDVHEVRDPNAVRENEGFRVYAPGAVHFGQIHLRAALNSPTGSLLSAWVSECRSGKNIRKNITVTLYRKDGLPTRAFHFFDIFPEEDELLTPDDCPGCPQDIVLHCSMRTLSLEYLGPPDPPEGRGIYVHLSDESTGELTPPERWFRWLGGEVRRHNDVPLAGTRYRLKTPGLRSVEEVTLRGPSTGQRKELCRWISETVQGNPWKRAMELQEILQNGVPGKGYNYFDCFPTRYSFPQFNTDQSQKMLDESITVKIGRIEFKT
jgi:hypothetical protein